MWWWFLGVYAVQLWGRKIILFFRRFPLSHCHRFHFLSGCERRKSCWFFIFLVGRKQRIYFYDKLANHLKASFRKKIYLNDITLCKRENPKFKELEGVGKQRHLGWEIEDALKASK